MLQAAAPYNYLDTFGLNTLFTLKVKLYNDTRGPLLSHSCTFNYSYCTCSLVTFQRGQKKPKKSCLEVKYDRKHCREQTIRVKP